MFIKAQDKTGLVWKFGENVGNVWNKGQVTIPKISDYSNFSVIFQGKW